VIGDYSELWSDSVRMEKVLFTWLPIIILELLQVLSTISFANGLYIFYCFTEIIMKRC